MSDVAIRVENIGKKFRLGQNIAGYKTLRDTLTYLPKRLLNRTKETPEEIWALRNVSFEVNRGDVIGIIGRNGAGKSSLLKILSRITEPTEGRAEIHGTVGTLLEVGTGFHPELSGRENIYMNGTILGMSKQDVRAKFDEIVEFSGVESFLDTPIKRYSSGMTMRLAFSVAAHLDTDILFVDEVLAVGDVAFQRKCISKMGDVAGHGKTILFVSHNLSTIQSLCTKGLYIKDGATAGYGEVGAITDRYLADLNEDTATNLAAVPVKGTTLTIDASRIFPLRIARKTPTNFSFVIRGRPGDEVDMLTLIIENQMKVRVAIINFSRHKPYKIPSEGGLVFAGKVYNIPLTSTEYHISIFVKGHWGQRVVELNSKFNILENEGVTNNLPLRARGVVDLDYDFDVKAEK